MAQSSPQCPVLLPCKKFGRAERREFSRYRRGAISGDARPCEAGERVRRIFARAQRAAVARRAAHPCDVGVAAGGSEVCAAGDGDAHGRSDRDRHIILVDAHAQRSACLGTAEALGDALVALPRAQWGQSVRWLEWCKRVLRAGSMQRRAPGGRSAHWVPCTR